MRLPVEIQVRGHQLARLRTMYEETSGPRTRLRVQMVLLCHDGDSVEEIAKLTRQSDEAYASGWIAFSKAVAAA